MDELKPEDRWQYYISSYTRAEPTEGVSRSRMRKVFLTRNLPSGDTDSDGDGQPKALSNREGLVLKICLNTSTIIYEEGTSNYDVFRLPSGSKEELAKRETRLKAITEMRNQSFVEKMAMNSPWMKNLGQEEVQQAKEDYQKWKDEAIPPPSRTTDDEAAANASLHSA